MHQYRFLLIYDERPYIKKLKKKLNEKKCDNIEEIVDNLVCKNDPILEMTNLMMFYRGWAKQNDELYDLSIRVKSGMKRYLNNEKDAEQAEVLAKFKSDIIAKIKNECNGEYFYSGLESFAEMSEGIPRLFLNILKHVYRWSDFQAEDPFKNKKISLGAQSKGIKQAAEWFYKDAIPAQNTSDMKISIERLGQLLRVIRYSDMPPECSLSAVNIDIKDLSEEVKTELEEAKKYSFLMELDKRIDKNTKRYNCLYKINGLLATRWGLPIFKRGDIKLNQEEVAAIFDPKKGEEFNQIVKEKMRKYSAPFPINRGKNKKQTKLFRD